MNTTVKVGGYAAGLVVAFGIAAAAGNLVGSTPLTETGHSESQHTGKASAHPSGGRDGGSSPAKDIPGGLMVSEGGYTLELTDDSVAAGISRPVSFRILGPDGKPVTDYQASHDKDLHFIAVRRDLTGFQHVHPQLSGAGTWATDLTLTPGEWRVFADFTPTARGKGLTLGADLSVAGTYRPEPLSQAAATAEVDGYTVTLAGPLAAAVETKLTLNVARDGVPVTDLQPYLAAYGHLVALRDGDLAYLHVHPAGGPGDGTTAPGPDITFYATAPSTGAYRLFLDFKHDGVVRTAEFTVTATGTAQPTSNPATAQRAPSTGPGSEPSGAASGHDDEAGHKGHGTR